MAGKSTAGGESVFDTIFSVTDQATAPLMGLSQAFEGAQIGISKTTALLSPLNTALGAIGAGLSLKGIEDIGKAYENNRIQMAQTAKSMGLGGASFADALDNADVIINQVNAAAAALPGEAEDYQKALQIAGVQVKNATGDYQKSFNLIRDMTAIGISMGESSAYTAMQMNRMLGADRGHLEMQSEYTQKILTAMHAMPGQANLTAQGFNAMKLADRLKLAEGLTAQFKDMIDASSNTMDAIEGASMTIFKTFTRQATSPLFDGMKEALKYANDQLMDANGAATELGSKLINVGHVISESIVGTIKEALTGKLDPNLLGAGVGAVASLAGGAAGPLMAVGAGLANFLRRTDDVSNVMGQLGDIVNLLMSPLDRATESFDLLGELMGDAIAGTLGDFLYAIQSVLSALNFVGNLTEETFKDFAEEFSKPLQAMWDGVGTLLSGIGDFLGPVIQVLGFALYGFYQLIKPVLNVLIVGLGELAKSIGHVLTWLGKWIGMTFELPANTIGVGNPSKGPSFLEKLAEAFKLPERKSLAKSLQGDADTKPPSATQDFRYSRFEISQKFAEGFDPDRIAVAFAKDVGKIGEQRLQSGFAPLFSVGI